ncbi:GTP 3',8-cyclase MoaA [Streptomyces filamentosus]|uniref:GTP 3',8-cyclase n=3 Tax=Streptomyces TaxID=1883 RepID=A0ABY4V422_STRFL|nr:GTP 3',8-cyclase MoaA [Streptomyces filamentosus]EFE72756.1 molybdenum cofactor biosynthesis protein A [Streptomyces filamentosus NRRL 15998]EWS89998.1 molybdenum cofactor biosynthesis protein A [Streptomyces filamentosus NRRL 11379]MYR77019.1 GTP 3',8-cyclase MoaA [Streptomyces sp. SID5466]USC51301.1 GTP 3',8-cyclase MoaA [Streptomyces filamentosus]
MSRPLPDGPAPSPLTDRFGRVHTDLRVSLTDRCNLRCTYCMPAEGLDWLPRPELLTDDEVVRLVDVATRRLGITEVRLTGGEPLLRRGLPGLVARLHALPDPPELSLTTNGIGLARSAAALRDAGLSRVNVSLDTLRPERFTAITRRDRLPDVLAGLRAARTAGLAPVKINTVPVRGVNDDEIGELAAFAVEHGYRARFIESMPLDAQGAWDRDRMVTAEEILGRLGERFDLIPAGRRDNAPAEEWRIAGTDTVVGVIASVTRPFCGGCDRVRLTADGHLRNCLFATEESDLRALLRGGAEDTEIEAAWRNCIAGKGPGHAIDSPEFRRPDRPMSAIGG